MVSIFHLKYQFRTVLTTMFREERYTVSMFPTEFYTIWWLDDFDIRKCAVGRINDTRYRNCFHAAQVLIGLPYFRHVLIDRLICNLFANIYCFNVQFTWVGCWEGLLSYNYQTRLSCLLYSIITRYFCISFKFSWLFRIIGNTSCLIGNLNILGYMTML